MGKATGSWLGGPTSATGVPSTHTYKGSTLGFPESGVGSVAPTGLRVGAMLTDWIPCAIISAAIFGFDSGNYSTYALLIWAAVGFVFVAAWGFTPGQLAWGLRTASVRPGSGGRPGPLAALVRVLLITLILPPLIQDHDGRGLHDRVTLTVLVRGR